LLEKTQQDGRPKMKVEDKIMGITHNLTTKCCYSCEEEGHLSRNYSRKRERFPTTMVEYEENEVRDLLALETPKKKKKMIKKKDNSKVMCFKCKELGHYADKCPERDNEATRQRGTYLVTCQKCNQKGHYARICEEKSTSRLQKMG
jgi:hypothetical protein